ncbi:MAG: 4Fe-4S dicluster domain-containing protein [Candidatus Hodarchaeales archaeon]|jgi:ferredoxin
MGIKAHIIKFLMGSVGARQIRKMNKREAKLTGLENFVKFNNDSPERFEIVLESLKYPANKLKLFNSLRTMRIIPSNMKNIKRSLTSFDHNSTALNKMISENLLQEFESFAKSLGVSSIGYTKLPKNLIFKNKAVLHDNAIVLSMEMDKEKIEQAPSSKTAVMIMKTYDDLGKASNQLSKFLRNNNFSAHAGHPLGGLVLYPPLAELAGIGYRGKHGLMITPEHGPRVRLTAIYTSIENLPFAEKNSHEWIQHFCEKCIRCIRKCPGFAIYDDPIRNSNGLLTHIKNDQCFPVFLEYHGCSICVKECPFSRVEFHKLERQFNTQTVDPEII